MSREEDAYVIERMGKLLAEIAIAVNGPEPPLTRWSYHDLPAKVRALKEAQQPAAAVPAGYVPVSALIEARDHVEDWAAYSSPYFQEKHGLAGVLAEIDAQIAAAQAQQLAKPAEQEPVNIGPEWAPCVKLPVTVHVRHQRPGEAHVSTREGITPIKPDDLIMRGVSGEEYPIGREIFERTYRLGEAPQPRRNVTYVCPVCAASLERQE